MPDAPAFVLLHSPLVGPTSWSWLADSLRARGCRVEVPSMLGRSASWTEYVDSAVSQCGSGVRLVLVGHSGAGPLLPVIADRLGDGVERLVFAEASLAPTEGAAELAPPWLLDHLRPLVQDGILPPWSAWWGPGRDETLVPDAERRSTIGAELPQLPFAYFTGEVPMPERWESRWPSLFLWYSDVYAEDAAAATARGWPVTRLAGGHLHHAVDPNAVADELLRLIVV